MFQLKICLLRNSLPVSLTPAKSTKSLERKKAGTGMKYSGSQSTSSIPRHRWVESVSRPVIGQLSPILHPRWLTLTLLSSLSTDGLLKKIPRRSRQYVNFLTTVNLVTVFEVNIKIISVQSQAFSVLLMMSDLPETTGHYFRKKIQNKWQMNLLFFTKDKIESWSYYGLDLILWCRRRQSLIHGVDERERDEYKKVTVPHIESRKNANNAKNDTPKKQFTKKNDQNKPIKASPDTAKSSTNPSSNVSSVSRLKKQPLKAEMWTEF